MGIKFCSNCASNELKSIGLNTGWICENCSTSFYLNSKPSVCGVIIQNEKILLVRPKTSDTNWDLPGGFLDFGESPESGLARELNEELSIVANVGLIQHAAIDNYGVSEFSINLFYTITDWSGQVVPSGEIIEIGWFNMNDLPILEYRSTEIFLKNKLMFRSI